MKILVVDDERDLAEMIKSAVEMQYNSTVLLAYNGHEGLSILEADPPDLVISDITMPDMDGLDMIRGLRKKRKDMPVIIITAYDHIENTVAAIRLGAMDFIRKPFKIEELYFSLDRILKMRHGPIDRAADLKQAGRLLWNYRTNNCDVSELASYLSMLITQAGLCSSHDFNSFYVVIYEAITNAREHGNLEMPSHFKDEDIHHYYAMMNERLNDETFAKRKINIELQYNDHEIMLKIRDEGNGFDHSVFDADSFYTNDHILKHYGKGLIIIKSYMDKVCFNDKGNEILLVKKISPAK